MSYTTAHWEKLDAREKFADLIKQVKTIGDPSFQINTDLILKTCLVLFNDHIKFQVKNLDEESVSKFEENWDNISSAIIEAFTLIKGWGFNDSNFKAKNAIIPIVYFIYHNKLQKEINKQNKHKEAKKHIRQWLCMALLKRVFGGQSDSVLRKIKQVLEKHKGDKTFPLDEIKEAFKDDPTKNLSFTDDFIDELLTTQKENSNCYTILALIYSHLGFDQPLHKDHLHPRSYFDKLKKDGKEKDKISEEDFKFYTDPKNFNSVLNLQLLDGNINESKSNTPLKDWVEENKIDRVKQRIPKDVSLDVNHFKEFINKRKDLLRKKLKKIIGDEKKT